MRHHKGADMHSARLKQHTGNILFALAVTTALPLAPAHAYLDAGSISMALQVTVGAIASGLMIGKLYLHRIMPFLGLRKAASDEAKKD